MQTVELRGSFYRVRVHPFDPAEPEAKASALLMERELEFGSADAAGLFLGQFGPDPFAVRGFQSVLARLEGSSSPNELSEQWIGRLAVHMAAGRVRVVEQSPRAPAGESQRDEGAQPLMAPVPRRESAAPTPAQDPSTFAANADESAQAQALKDAAQNGTPFCEECAKAASNA